MAPGFLISPKTTGFDPGTDTSLPAMPRFAIIWTMLSALRRMLARSLAILGIESSDANSSTMARSCC